MDRQTDIWTDRQTDRKTDRQTVRQTERQTDEQTDRQTYRQIDRQKHIHTDRQTDIQTDNYRNLSFTMKVCETVETCVPGYCQQVLQNLCELGACKTQLVLVCPQKGNSNQGSNGIRQQPLN